MQFSFQKYVNPIWYFNLSPNITYPVYWVDWEKINELERFPLTWEEGYSSQEVAKMDIAWQAIQKGIIACDENKRLNIKDIKPSTFDNYLFLRKYFHPLWSYYVLFIRLITFYNPIFEFNAFLNARKTNRKSLYVNVYSHENTYINFNSRLINKLPLVTVIIPTLNRYSYLADALTDLEQQDYKHFEVIIVDQSEPFQADFYQSWKLNLRVIRQKEKALWLARNSAVEQSLAEFLLFFDDDSRVGKDWISQHLKGLDYFCADISSGVSLSKIGAQVPESYAFFKWSDQLDTGNALIRREVFRKVGLFDRQFERQRMGDGEFGLRAYLAGYKIISNPYASRLHLKVAIGGLRQMGYWDAFRSKSWFSPRPVPSVLYFTRKYFGNHAAIRLLAINIGPSLLPYKFKRKNAFLLLGIPLAILSFPVVLFQVIRSWKKSNKMLTEGPLIDCVVNDPNP